MELTEHEQKLYDELFKMCDLHKTAKIPKIVVGELFSSSRLPADISLQIADLCGASRLGYFGRSQFYIALKYIAAAQQQLPLNHEQVFGNSQLPIINRTALSSQLSNHIYDYATYIALLEPQTTPSMPPPPVHMISVAGVLPPPPTKKHVRNVSGTIQPGSLQSSLAQPHPSQLNNSHPILPHGVTGQAVPVNTQNASQISDQVQPITSQVDTPDGAVGWASFPSPTKNRSGPEATVAINIPPSQSPTKVTSPGDGPSTTADWNLCGVSKRSFNLDSCSLSSADYATSEASESMDDIWCINDEQREYYVNQFQSMQKDLTSTIKGPIAKGFFEKSKLPTSELSVIWKLSDVNKDGALTLQEFCTAMHLVVLRRNEVELPTVLPPSLMPYTPASREPFASDLGEHQARRSPSPAVPAIQSQGASGWAGGPSATDTARKTSWPATENPNQWTERQLSHNEGWNSTDPNQQWQQTGSEVSSVNWRSEASESGSPLQTQWTGSSHSPTISVNLVTFDSSIVTGDPELAHPVPVKVSPSSQNSLIDGTVRSRTDTDVGYTSVAMALPARDRSNTEGSVTHPLQPLPVRPRPTPKKAQSIGGASTIESNLIYPPPPQTLHGYQSLPGTTAFPPMVPPRNRWSVSSPDQDMRVGGENHHPHTVDPFSAGGDLNVENFADFSTKFGEPSNEPFSASISDNHASNDILPAGTVHSQSVLLPAVPALRPQIVAHQFSIRDKKEIQLSIKRQRERNEILVRSSSELHSELQEVVEQRISLEIQLEHLKPC